MAPLNLLLDRVKVFKLIKLLRFGILPDNLFLDKLKYLSFPKLLKLGIEPVS